MSYRVVWLPKADFEIRARQFLALETGRDADVISRAAAEIERRLTDDPAEQGESRAEPERVLIVDPLTVTFEVFERAQVVLIYNVVHHPGRQP